MKAKFTAVLYLCAVRISKSSNTETASLKHASNFLSFSQDASISKALQINFSLHIDQLLSA